MKSAAQRLQALDADLARVKAARASHHKAMVLKALSLMPRTNTDRVNEWRRLWLSQPLEIERQLAEVEGLGSDPMSTTRYPGLSRWVLALADTPDDDLPPAPPAEAQAQLETMASEWERAALEKCAGQPEKQRAALWLGGFCRYFACLAQVLESATP